MKENTLQSYANRLQNLKAIRKEKHLNQQADELIAEILNNIEKNFSKWHSETCIGPDKYLIGIIMDTDTRKISVEAYIYYDNEKEQKDEIIFEASLLNFYYVLESLKNIGFKEEQSFDSDFCTLWYVF